MGDDVVSDYYLLWTIIEEGQRSAAFTRVGLEKVGPWNLVRFIWQAPGGFFRKGQEISAAVLIEGRFVKGTYSKPWRTSYPGDPIEIFRLPVTDDHAALAVDVVNRMAAFFAAKQR